MTGSHLTYAGSSDKPLPNPNRTLRPPTRPTPRAPTSAPRHPPPTPLDTKRIRSGRVLASEVGGSGRVFCARTLPTWADECSTVQSCSPRPRGNDPWAQRDSNPRESLLVAFTQLRCIPDRAEIPRPETRHVEAQRRSTTAQVAELLVARHDGATVDGLGRQFGIHRTTVLAHLQREGRSRLPSPSPETLLPAEPTPG